MSKNRDRLAYIVGNNNYQELKPLKGALNDANMMEAALKNCEFATRKNIDLNYEEFRNVLYEFKSKCMEYNVCLFYYAGHGFEYKGSNYLCPIDGKMEKIDESNINISNLVNEVSKDRDFVCIVILDCCRDIYHDQERGSKDVNPIVADFKNEGGTYIAYATSSGESAVEYGENGLYTRVLCKHISDSNKPIEQIFKDVRKEMLNTFVSKGGRKQISWEYSSLVNEFYFKESVMYVDVSSMAERVVQDACSYDELLKYVNQYCVEHGVKDKGKILLNVLNAIDDFVKQGEQYK